MFSDCLKMLIEERELTQKQIATDLKIPISTFGGYVQGTSEPDFEVLLSIARYFGVTADYLLGNKSPTAQTAGEEDIIRIYRSLTPEQQELFTEQGKVFIRYNHKSKKP